MSGGRGTSTACVRPDVATVEALYHIIAGSGVRSLAVVGLVKNAGKTTVVNALMAHGASCFGLTSLGLDGEKVDHLTGLAKPRIAPPPGTLEATTRLYGQVWTAGPQVVVRWYEAHPPDGEKVPICAVARLSYDQMRKLPESKPGMAILDGSTAAAYIVDSFR